MNGTEAYLAHVSAKAKRSTAARQAVRMTGGGGPVALRVAELRLRAGAVAERKFDLSREKWLRLWLGNFRRARREGNISAAYTALRELGRAMPGWYEPEAVRSEGRLDIVIRKL